MVFVISRVSVITGLQNTGLATQKFRNTRNVEVWIQLGKGVEKGFRSVRQGVVRGWRRVGGGLGIGLLGFKIPWLKIKIENPKEGVFASM